MGEPSAVGWDGAASGRESISCRLPGVRRGGVSNDCCIVFLRRVRLFLSLLLRWRLLLQLASGLMPLDMWVPKPTPKVIPPGLLRGSGNMPASADASLVYAERKATTGRDGEAAGDTSKQIVAGCRRDAGWVSGASCPTECKSTTSPDDVKGLRIRTRRPKAIALSAFRFGVGR